ncbi:hypothetical protein HK096_001861 [Nowakowskiella sp. JEL0078]|nr:hypothetical protein HK096_001861 [Nowakowskiella sp. JEL0078]
MIENLSNYNNALPHDILIHIFKFLEGNSRNVDNWDVISAVSPIHIWEILVVGCVCHSWRSAVTELSSWKSFPVSNHSIPVNSSILLADPIRAQRVRSITLTKHSIASHLRRTENPACYNDKNSHLWAALPDSSFARTVLSKIPDLTLISSINLGSTLSQDPQLARTILQLCGFATMIRFAFDRTGLSRWSEQHIFLHERILPIREIRLTLSGPDIAWKYQSFFNRSMKILHSLTASHQKKELSILEIIAAQCVPPGIDLMLLGSILDVSILDRLALICPVTDTSASTPNMSPRKTLLLSNYSSLTQLLLRFPRPSAAASQRSIQAGLLFGLTPVALLASLPNRTQLITLELVGGWPIWGSDGTQMSSRVFSAYNNFYGVGQTSDVFQNLSINQILHMHPQHFEPVENEPDDPFDLCSLLSSCRNLRRLVVDDQIFAESLLDVLTPATHPRLYSFAFIFVRTYSRIFMESLIEKMSQLKKLLFSSDHVRDDGSSLNIYSVFDKLDWEIEFEKLSEFAVKRGIVGMDIKHISSSQDVEDLIIECKT